MDSTKFWELVRVVESQGKITTEVRNVSNISTQTSTGSVRPITQTGSITPRPGTSTGIVATPPVTGTPQPGKDTSTSVIQEDGIKTMMKNRIAKLPTATKYASLVKIEQVVLQNLSAAKSKNNATLIRKYTALLSVVQEEINTMKVDDATIVNALFAQ